MSATPLPAEQDVRSVAELLHRRAQQRPNQRAFVFLPDAGERGRATETAWTYAELDERARAVAAAVSRAAQPGDRAVLVFPPGLDFLAAFFGCLYAGVLPAPATYPKPRRPSSRLDAIVADCSPALGLTAADTLAAMNLSGQSNEVQQLTWLTVDQCSADAVAAPRSLGRDDTAFVQYTSGSTSDPRGVVVTHGNLLHNLELIRGGFGIARAEDGAETTIGAFWLPAYHDMGLIGGLLTPLYVGGTSYLLAPATFLQRPLAWLETLSRTKASISGAPNFAYDLCVQKTSEADRAALDLSNWRVAFCGAEPIDARALDDFAAAFAPAGFRPEAFYPCYGLAESTLMVAGGAGPGRPRVLRADRQQLAAGALAPAAAAADALPVVSCGRPLGNQQVRIVDPQSGKPCPDGAVGEVWIRGDSVATGYWNRPEEREHTFGGRTADGDGPYLRTGDLGAFDGGDLFITGRIKDLIIIRGRNLYPQDVERTARDAHQAVELGAAFSTVIDSQEQLVLVHQAAREHRRADMLPVVRAIRSAIVEEHEIDPAAIVIVRPAALPITSSGKIQRSQCRAMYESGSLDPLYLWQRPVAPRKDRPASPTAAPPQSAPTSAPVGSAPAAEAPQRPKFLDRLGAYTPAALSAEIQQWMLAWLSDRVGVAASDLSPQAPFSELGIDSLTAIELNVEFERTLSLRVPPVAAWSYPTPAALSQYMADLLLGVTPAGGPNGALPADSWFEAMEADARGN